MSQPTTAATAFINTADLGVLAYEGKQEAAIARLYDPTDWLEVSIISVPLDTTTQLCTVAQSGRFQDSCRLKLKITPPRFPFFLDSNELQLSDPSF